MARFVPVHLMRWRRVAKVTKIEKIKARQGDFIVWDARQTRGSIRLFFPDKSLFGVSVLEVPAGEARFTRVLARTRGRKHYRYSAFFDQYQDFAVGASSPIIIVDP